MKVPAKLLNDDLNPQSLDAHLESTLASKFRPR